MKRLFAILSIALLIGVVLAQPGLAAKPQKTAPVVNVTIDISSQSMAVNVKGWPYGRWKVSTARGGYHTPRGRYRPFALRKVYFSRKYDNAPMPNSVFFYGGYAIHGTFHLKQLGRPASHGCIRLAPDHALKLYELVQKHGLASTRITIVD